MNKKVRGMQAMHPVSVMGVGGSKVPSKPVKPKPGMKKYKAQ